MADRQIKINSPWIDARERIRHIPIHIENRPTVYDVEKMRQFVRRTGIRAWVSSAVGANRRPEYYGSPLYRSQVMDFDLHPDADPEYLPRLVQMAHEEGIVFLSWFPMTHVWAGAHAHPEWQVQFLPEGRTPGDDTCCLLSTGYLDFVIAISQEIVTSVGFDGLWFDGTGVGCMYGSEPGVWGCVCPGCRSGFKHDTGLDIPARWNWPDAAFRAFVLWTNRRKIEVLSQITDHIRQVRPDACVFYNHSSAGPMPNGGRFNDWRVNMPLDDDGSGTSHGNEAMEGLSPLLYARMGESLRPGDFDVWRPLSQVSIPWNSALEPPLEEILMHTYAQIAHGGAAFLGLHQLTDNCVRVLAEVIRESDRREPWRGGQSYRHLAIHLSQAARDFYAQDDPSRYLKSWFGAYEMTAECGLPLGILFDSQLTLNHLDGYRTIFLPESTCLSDAQAQAIKEFVYRGGILIATGQTGTLDEQGQPRSVGVLDDLLGIERETSGSLRWMIVGPFDNPESKGFDIPYGPELGQIDLTAEYVGACGKTVRWKSYPIPGNYVNFLDQFLPKEWVCAYAYTIIESPEECDAIYVVGSDDGIKIWLNDQLVHRMFRLRGVYQEQDVVPVHLRKGKNHILVKVEQRFWDWGFILQILRPAEPIKPFKADFNTVCPADADVRSVIGSWVWMGSNPVAFKLLPDSEVRVFAHKMADKVNELQANFMDPISCVSESTAVTTRRFGKGEAIYINTDLGQTQIQYPGIGHRELFKFLACRRDAALKVTGPPCVELSAFWKDDRLICHLLNRPFTSARPILQENCRSLLFGQPLRAKVELTIRAEKKIKRVFLPLEDRKSEAKQDHRDANTFTVCVDVDRHQIVVFEGVKLKEMKNENQ
ncbi:MAG: alpha-amylase family protein [Phycisphaerae bacterium]